MDSNRRMLDHATDPVTGWIWVCFGGDPQAGWQWAAVTVNKGCCYSVEIDEPFMGHASLERALASGVKKAVQV